LEARPDSAAAWIRRGSDSSESDSDSEVGDMLEPGGPRFEPGGGGPASRLRLTNSGHVVTYLPAAAAGDHHDIKDS
jgi:hypothetical protein